jgi:hypothetical protein
VILVSADFARTDKTFELLRLGIEQMAKRRDSSLRLEPNAHPNESERTDATAALVMLNGTFLPWTRYANSFQGLQMKKRKQFDISAHVVSDQKRQGHNSSTDHSFLGARSSRLGTLSLSSAPRGFLEFVLGGLTSLFLVGLLLLCLNDDESPNEGHAFEELRTPDHHNQHATEQTEEHATARSYPISARSSRVDDQFCLQPEIANADFQQGTWGWAYQHANEEQLRALELLFLCNIIPAEVFPDCDVSKEHVDECIWIALHMLRKQQ